MYTKKQQIGKRHKPKAKDRSKIKLEDYRKASDFWGVICIVCGNPHIEMHHVKFRSQGGSGRWRNLLPLCQKHHQMAHQDNSIRRTLEWKMEEVFGSDYWKDEYTLHDEGKINNPTVSEYEKHFEVM